jgi:large subunit ribosomal protein L22
MEARAQARQVRYGCRKLRQVADLVRGKSVDEAMAMLSILRSQKKGAVIMENVLKSAVANFQTKEGGAGVRPEDLTLATVFVDGGPIIKRIRPRSQGRAYRIHKNLSHVTVVVKD